MEHPSRHSNNTAENTKTSVVCTSNIHAEETDHRSRTHAINSQEKRAVQTSASSQMPVVL